MQLLLEKELASNDKKNVLLRTTNEKCYQCLRTKGFQALTKGSGKSVKEGKAKLLLAKSKIVVRRLSSGPKTSVGAPPADRLWRIERGERRSRDRYRHFQN